MRLPIWLTSISALVGLAIVFAIGSFFLQPPTNLILSAGFSSETITPNADGDHDITQFSYEIARNAQVTIEFESE
ncbi:MAG: hypothetical protein AAF126_06400, partial [Chloroflexota bacterium]